MSPGVVLQAGLDCFPAVRGSQCPDDAAPAYNNLLSGSADIVPSVTPLRIVQSALLNSIGSGANASTSPNQQGPKVSSPGPLRPSLAFLGFRLPRISETISCQRLPDPGPLRELSIEGRVAIIFSYDHNRVPEQPDGQRFSFKACSKPSTGKEA